MPVEFDYSVEEKSYKVMQIEIFIIGEDYVGEKVFSGSTITRI
jgi:hypothetical protein